MKKVILSFIPAMFLILFAVSCSKDDPATPAATPEGKWVGTGQYGTTPGNPTYAFTVTFKANGTVDVIGNNNVAIDTAAGTWQLVQDSVKATYTYAAASAIYTLSGKYSASSNVMTGTIGLGTATTGVGIFTITKQ